jgi:hypothetical protein
MKTIIGIDNGPTGSIGIITDAAATFHLVPTSEYLHYGKKGTFSKRLNRAALIALLTPHKETARVFIERPFTGSPMMIMAVLSAHRFFEATIITLEDLKIGYEVIDSKTWQMPVLGGISGSAALKRASKLRGIQLYPMLSEPITKHKDADGLMIAHRFFYHEQFQEVAKAIKKPKKGSAPIAILAA